MSNDTDCTRTHREVLIILSAQYLMMEVGFTTYLHPSLYSAGLLEIRQNGMIPLLHQMISTKNIIKYVDLTLILGSFGRIKKGDIYYGVDLRYP